MKYGYARMTTNEEDLQKQLDQLNEEGCTEFMKKSSQEQKEIDQNSRKF